MLLHAHHISFFPQVDKAIGTDCEFLSEEDFLHHAHHNGHHNGPAHLLSSSSSRLDMINMNMSFDSVRDIDSISQISAMDSASQTGNHSVNGGSLVDYKYRSASADALLPRSVSVGELMAQPGMAAPNAVNGGGGGANSGTYRRGQFPYAYIRSKLSVLPEEHAGQLSRRESMNQNGDQAQAHAHAHAQQLAQHVIYRVSQQDDLEEGDIDDDLLSSVTTRSEIVHNTNNGEGGNNHGVFRQRQMALRRKRSLSVADIPVPEGFQDPRKLQQQQHHVARQQSVRQQSARQPIPPTHHSRYQHRQQRSKCEESGYDSDTTRKSSPRGSLKVDPSIAGGNADHFDTTSSSGGSSGGKADDTEDSASSGSEDSGNVSSEMKNSEEDLKKKVISTAESGNTSTLIKKELVTGSGGKQTIKKPPRKSKLPEATFRTTTKPVEGHSVSTSTTPVMRRFKKHNENSNSSNNNLVGYEEGSNSPPERRKSESALPSSGGNVNYSESSIPSNLPSLTSKRFKMLRLKKAVEDDLGIVISKKRHPQKGTTGYIIAHIEEEGLVER